MRSLIFQGNKVKATREQFVAIEFSILFDEFFQFFNASINSVKETLI